MKSRTVKSCAMSLFVVVVAQSAFSQDDLLSIVENLDRPVGFDLNMPSGAQGVLANVLDSDQFFAMTEGDATGGIEKFELAPFFFRLDSTLRYTSNAFSSHDDEESDVLLESVAQFGFATALDKRPDLVFKAAGYAGVTRYYDSSVLDSNIVGGTFALTWTKPQPPNSPVLTLSAIYGPSAIYDRDFDQRVITSHSLSGTVQLLLPLGEANSGWSLVLGGKGGRVLTDPSAFEYWELQGSPALVWSNNAKTLTVQGGVKVRYRSYDDYFEAVFGESRQDVTVNPAVAAEWKWTSNISVSAGVDFIDNQSSLLSKDYDAVVAQIALGLKF